MHSSSLSESSEFFEDGDPSSPPLRRQRDTQDEESSVEQEAAELASAFERFVRCSLKKAPKQGARTRAARGATSSFAAILRRWIRVRVGNKQVIDPFDPDATHPSKRFREMLHERFTRATA